MGFHNARSRFENELVKVLCEELGDEWFGQRGTHSYGIDVIMFKASDNVLKPSAVLFEVKSITTWPFYLSKKNKQQYEKYHELLDSKGVEVVYAIRLMGEKEDKWRFAELTSFSMTTRGNPCLKHGDTEGLRTFVHKLKNI